MRLILSILIILFLSTIIDLSHATDNRMRKADLDNILVVKTDRGEFLIELAVEFAPNHAKHMKKLSREGFFDNRVFYRVIENFIAQTGSGDDIANERNKNLDKLIDAEFTRSMTTDFEFTSTGHGDAYASETGFSRGFPVGVDNKNELAWITHCPGTIGMARKNNANSGGTDWYIVIGQSPRHLDRNITVFGRVIDGLEVVQSMPHGMFPTNNIESDNGKTGGVIVSVRVLSDLKERITILIENTQSEYFSRRLESKKNRTHEWFIYTPPIIVDICTMNIRVQIN